jgi:NADH-quinone oxidoreductase subunit N
MNADLMSAQLQLDGVNLDWHAVAPQLILAVAACVVMVVDLFLPQDKRWLAMPLSAVGIIMTLGSILSLVGPRRETFGGTFEVDGFSLLFEALFCVIGLIVLGISFNYFRSGRYHQGEFYFLLLCSLLGALVMAAARELIAIFVALELISVPGFVMTALRKGDARSNEAALKFFLFSVLSSAVMLYGMSLVYGITGETKLDAIRSAIGSGVHRPVLLLSVLFIIVGFGFKISAVPFHFWAPDTYEGAPSPVAAFLATASKIGGFVGLLVLMFQAFPALADSWRPMFAALAVATMTVGNLTALRQRHIIRLLAYSGIAQSGYVLVTLALVDPDSPASVTRRAFSAAVIYLAIYALMELGAFACAVAFADRKGTYFIEDYSGLWQRNPALATLLAGFLVSLAGAPPMAGAWAKLFVFLAAINAQVYWLAIVMAINTVIAAWYYLAVIRRMFFDPPRVKEPIELPNLMRLAMGLSAFALLATFVYPPIITFLAERSAAVAL